MTIKELNGIFQDTIGKSPHVSLELSLKKDMYTKEFIDFHQRHLSKKIRLCKLIGTEIDNKRWSINEDCNIILESIPVYSERFLEIRTVLNSDIRGFLSTKNIKKIRECIRKLQKHVNITDEEIFYALYSFNEEHHIDINQEAFESEIFLQREPQFLY